MKSRIVYFLLTLLAIFGIGFSQHKLEKIKIQNAETIYFSPQKEHLLFTTFGFRSVVADLLWLKAASYFINKMGKGSDCEFLVGMYDACITLDPKFKQVYRDLMSFLLNDEKYFKDVERLLLKGQEELKEDWEINYHLGILYAFYIKDKDKSLEAFEKAWNLLPDTDELKPKRYIIQSSIRAVTEDHNKGFDLVRYWLQKINIKKSEESKKYVLEQIQYYFSLFMAEELNKVFKLEESVRKEALDKKTNEIRKLVYEYQLVEFLSLDVKNIFIKTDAYGEDWMYDKSGQGFFSFGAGIFELKRKLTNYQFALMGYFKDYREPIDFNYAQMPSDKWYLHFRKKNKSKPYPSAEEVFMYKALPKMKTPLLPRYNQEYGVFEMPSREDVQNQLNIKD